MECQRCLLTSEVTKIKNGECEFCRTHDKLEKRKPEYVDRLVRKLKKKKGYQVLIGISGGLDSSYLLWYTVNVLGLKPLVLHFNNKWNTQAAERNMSLLVEKLGVDLIRISSDDEYDELCGAFLKAGVKDADIPNDMYMADLMQTVAKKYKIKYVFNGHDFRYEGSTPLCWTYMDARYMRDVYYQMTGKKLKTPHVQTFWKQIVAGLRGIKHIRVFHYINIPQVEKLNTLNEFGIESYGPKHGENIYTKFIGYYLLPLRWGIDKRIIYLSAQVRSGLLEKEIARGKLADGVRFEKEWFPEIERRTGVRVQEAMIVPRKTYKDFKHYHFRRWRPLIWLLAVLKLTSYTFYKKYAT